MKIRNGFVSNSSSSSFCIYGARVDTSQVNKEKLKNTNLETIWGGYGDYYLGREWCNIGLEETGREFMENVEKAIKEVTGEDIGASTYEEAWFDG